MEPTKEFGGASGVLFLSGKIRGLSTVIPVVQQRPPFALRLVCADSAYDSEKILAFIRSIVPDFLIDCWISVHKNCSQTQPSVKIY